MTAIEFTGEFLPRIGEWGRSGRRALLLAGDVGIELRGPVNRAVLEVCRYCGLWCVTSDWFGRFPPELLLVPHERAHESEAGHGA